MNVLPPPGGAQHVGVVGSSGGHPSIAHPDHGVPSLEQLLGQMLCQLESPSSL